ncbi:hypothetical protein [Solibacillus sp. FSL K6-4121]|uniref:hypothetical protein n=1 Tax=Solibacillus sp. FSL K6-4121 TaxID=2921505 RepID=UPI0030F54990
MDDVNTLADKNASGLDKGIALASFIPVGKVLKIPKTIDKIVDSNAGAVVRRVMLMRLLGRVMLQFLPNQVVVAILKTLLTHILKNICLGQVDHLLLIGHNMVKMCM